ncbi:MAG: 4Fe-4S binding protein [Acidimicrobiales bacterium]
MTAAWPGTIGIEVADRCTACGLCLATCPEGALSRAPHKPSTAAQRCTACLACVEVCPVDAITVSTEEPWR